MITILVFIALVVIALVVGMLVWMIRDDAESLGEEVNTAPTCYAQYHDDPVSRAKRECATCIYENQCRRESV